MIFNNPPRKKIFLIVSLFLIFSFNVLGLESSFNVVETFDNSNFEITGAGISCGIPTNITGSDLTTGVCTWESFATRIADNSSNVYSATGKSAEIYFDNTVNGLSIVLQDICPYDECRIKNDTRIIIDADLTSGSKSSSDHKAVSGFITDIDNTETLPYNYDFSTFFYAKADNDRCKMDNFGQTIIDGYKRYNFTIQDMLNGDVNCYMSNTSSVVNDFVFSTEHNALDLQYIDRIELQNIYYGTNEQPAFNVTTDRNYYCLNKSESYPLTVNLNWTILDKENDNIYYAYLYNVAEKQYYKDYQGPGFLSYLQWKIDADSLSDGLYYNPSGTGCNFTEHVLYEDGENHIVTYPGHEADYSELPFNYQGYGLELNNDCRGYDIYTVKTKWDYREFHYNTTIYGLGNGENYTIQFLDQNLNDVVNFLVKGDNGNLTLSTSDGTNYVEIYDEAIDYNITSIDLIYYDNATIRFGGRTKVYYILSDNPSSDKIVSELTNIDFISYVRINFTNLDYGIQTMYSYQGEAQIIEWDTTQPSTVTAYSDGVHSYNFYVRDDQHSSYDKLSLSFKTEQKDYCFYGIEEYPIIDNLIGNPLKNFFSMNATEKQVKNSIYFLFFAMIIVFMVGLFMSTQRLNIFLPIMFSSLICFGLAFIIGSSTMITFIITFAISIILIGVNQ